MISNLSGQKRKTDNQFKVSKQNSILDLIDTYGIQWKAEEGNTIFNYPNNFISFNYNEEEK